MRSPLTPILLTAALCAAILGLADATVAVALLSAFATEALAAPKG